MITGKYLIDLGYKPGKWFKEAIEHVNANNLEGKELEDYLSSVCPPPTIDLFEIPASYAKNIKAGTLEEIENLNQVDQTMKELMKTPTVVTGCIMPDACPTGKIGQIPVGGVVVTANAIHPAMHSADICCSVMLTNLGQTDPKLILDIAYKNTHFGPGGRRENKYKIPNALFEKISANRFLNSEKSLLLAATHLGTQGDGNHFLFVGVNNAGDTCLVTHHGSRGFGAQLYKEGMRVAERFRKELSPKTLPVNAWIPYDSKEGKEYWEALQIVREWTKLNHEVLHDSIADQALGIHHNADRFWNEHNFVFKVETEKESYFAHAKGATPLSDIYVPDSVDGLRIIPLNMAEPILIVVGAASENNLGFAPHGAGRNMSRTQHKKNKGIQSIEEIFAEETKGLDIRFYSGNIDISELPSAYKNAKTVRDQIQEFGLGEVVDEIKPYGCLMAGDFSGQEPWRKKKLIKESI